MRIVRDPHRCLEVFYAMPRHGVIVECSCGRQWRGYEPGNPDYATWKRVWWRRR